MWFNAESVRAAAWVGIREAGKVLLWFICAIVLCAFVVCAGVRSAHHATPHGAEEMDDCETESESGEPPSTPRTSPLPLGPPEVSDGQ